MCIYFQNFLLSYENHYSTISMTSGGKPIDKVEKSGDETIITEECEEKRLKQDICELMLTSDTPPLICICKINKVNI